MKIRVGFGYDVHALVPNRALWLGGIRIEHTLGLLGHSDADVLIHAICDALLGAANLRDIGYHFPDTAGEYENIDSKILLRKTMALIREAGYELGNIDATVCAERPKLNPHIPQMKMPSYPANTPDRKAFCIYTRSSYCPAAACCALTARCIHRPERNRHAPSAAEAIHVMADTQHRPE